MSPGTRRARMGITLALGTIALGLVLAARERVPRDTVPSGIAVAAPAGAPALAAPPADTAALEARQEEQTSAAFESELRAILARARAGNEHEPGNEIQAAPPARSRDTAPPASRFVARTVPWPEPSSETEHDLRVLEVEAARIAEHLRLRPDDVPAPRALPEPEQRRAEAQRRASLASALLEEWTLRREWAHASYAAAIDVERTLRPRARQRVAEATPELRVRLLARAISELETLPAAPVRSSPHPARAPTAR